MSLPIADPVLAGTPLYAEIADGLVDRGYAVLSSSLPEALLDALFLNIKETDRNKFHRAGIGREQLAHQNDFVRTDRVLWLEGSNSATNQYLQWMNQLRLYLNRTLFLGLLDYESHYAYYPVGSFYKRHVDAFRGDRNRVLTTVLYLNPGWTTADEGELVLYSPDGEQTLEKIQPAYGTLVVFLSEEFPHEVLPTRRARFSATGWFRVNNSLGSSIDPPR